MTLHKTADSPPQAPLWGLVLAGGESERMGEDKGLLDYHGLPQVVRVRLQLQEFCQQVFVSMNATQARSAPYATLQKIVDHEPRRGPASGLLSAWNAFPMTAWLVVAVDLPFLDRETLQALVAGRDSTLLATAFQHPDGPLEPLCAIWGALGPAGGGRELRGRSGILAAGPRGERNHGPRTPETRGPAGC